jgi:hypothetical protein
MAAVGYDIDFIEPIRMMKFQVLVARYARAIPVRMRVALPLLIMAVLYWLSSLPGKPLPGDTAAYALFYWISPTVQNTLHIPAYAALSWAWGWTLDAWLRTWRAQALGACAITSAYGVFDEWHQSFVPGRYASLSDVAFDMTGALIGVWLAAWISRQ